MYALQQWPCMPLHKWPCMPLHQWSCMPLHQMPCMPRQQWPYSSACCGPNSATVDWAPDRSRAPELRTRPTNYWPSRDQREEHSIFSWSSGDELQWNGRYINGTAPNMPQPALFITRHLHDIIAGFWHYSLIRNNKWLHLCGVKNDKLQSESVQKMYKNLAINDRIRICRKPLGILRFNFKDRIFTLHWKMHRRNIYSQNFLRYCKNSYRTNSILNKLTKRKWTRIPA